mgnify:FL=1
MALYSWFLRTDKKPSVKNVDVNKDLVQESQPIKCIAHYTMWPTAKIKPNIEITLSSTIGKPVAPKKVVLPSKVTFTTIKN